MLDTGLISNKFNKLTQKPHLHCWELWAWLPAHVLQDVPTESWAMAAPEGGTLGFH